LVTFQINAVLIAANTAMRLGDTSADETVRRALEALLTPAGPTKRIRRRTSG
jgi:hypothetical protein